MRAAFFVYEGLRSLFVFGGEVVACVGMRIKQGCPLSGSLFALCVDKLSRGVSSALSRRRRVYAYSGHPPSS